MPSELTMIISKTKGNNVITQIAGKMFNKTQHFFNVNNQEREVKGTFLNVRGDIYGKFPADLTLSVPS